jgi:hypothetical protein
MEKQIRTGRPFLPLGPFSSTGYFNLIKKPLNHKNCFVKNPLSAPAFGQNKTLKLCQNNVVINSDLDCLPSSQPPPSSE